MKFETGWQDVPSTDPECGNRELAPCMGWRKPPERMCMAASYLGQLYSAFKVIHCTCMLADVRCCRALLQCICKVSYIDAWQCCRAHHASLWSASDVASCCA